MADPDSRLNDTVFADSMLPAILRRHPPSEEQAKAIFASRSNVLITAGAGTGKTRTLVGRFLYLLDQGADLRSLVAITFTRKAAREMRNRIREAVVEHLRHLPPADPSRERWQRVIAEMDGARIGTIHSFCSDLLRSHPVEARIDPGFAVLEEGQMALLAAQAVESALVWAAERADLASLLVDPGEGQVRKLVSSLLASRPDLQGVAGERDTDPSSLLAQWEALLAERRHVAFDALLTHPAWRAQTETLTGFTPRNHDDRIVQQWEAALAAVIRAETGTEAERVENLARLRDINLTGGTQSAWTGGKGELEAVKACLKSLRDQTRAQETLWLVLNETDEAVARILSQLYPVVAVAHAAYSAAKAERRVLDFDDLERRAVDLLREHPEVQQQWRSRVSALLVDEFQDTNARQRQLLDYLNNGSRLFLVGDAKQSIYAFRGADVTVFRDARQTLSDNGGKVLELVETYRGHAGLVGALNTLLKPVLGEAEDPLRPWREPFAPLTAHRTEPAAGFRAPHVEVHVAAGTKSDGGLERAAQSLATRIVHLIQNGVCHPGDIAILCRASSSFPAYENALERAGVPFLTVAGKGFYDRPEVRDLLNILQALQDPGNDLALVGALRSPALGLSDAALLRLVDIRADLERQAGSHHKNEEVRLLPEVELLKPTLWDVLKNHGGLLGDEAGQAARAVELISDLHASVGRASAADVLKRFLDSTDYRPALLAAGQRRSERNVSKLLADARRSGFVKVSDLLDYVRQARDVDMREGEARAPEAGVVQIMSIHQAKGLEFPVVVLGDLAYRGGNRASHYLLHGKNGQMHVALPYSNDDDKLRPALYALAKKDADDREDAEAARLLYVAATRAKERLILNGSTVWKAGAPQWDGWWKRLAPALALHDSAWPEANDGGSASHQIDLWLDDEPVSCTIYEARWQSTAVLGAAAAAELPASKLLVEPVEGHSAAPEATDEEPDVGPPRRVWRVIPPGDRTEAPQWVVGKLIHAAIAQWRFEGLDDWLAAKARGMGVIDPAEIRRSVQRAQRLLDRFRRHPLWREVNAASQRWHEVPVDYLSASGATSGRIDILYRADSGAWKLVDFKTDRLRTMDDLDTSKHEDYVRQVRNYLSSAAVLLEPAPQASLCFLNVDGSIVIEPVFPDPA